MYFLIVLLFTRHINSLCKVTKIIYILRITILEEDNHVYGYLPPLLFLHQNQQEKENCKQSRKDRKKVRRSAWAPRTLQEKTDRINLPPIDTDELPFQ